MTDLSDSEIDAICAGLVQNAAKVRESALHGPCRGLACAYCCNAGRLDGVGMIYYCEG